MTSDDLSPRTRALRRYPLGAEPGDDLSAQTTAAERLQMVDVLSRRMWELTGKPWPQIPRSEWPVRIVRRV